MPEQDSLRITVHPGFAFVRGYAAAVVEFAGANMHCDTLPPLFSKSWEKSFLTCTLGALNCSIPCSVCRALLFELIDIICLPHAVFGSAACTIVFACLLLLHLVKCVWPPVRGCGVSMSCWSSSCLSNTAWYYHLVCRYSAALAFHHSPRLCSLVPSTLCACKYNASRT